MKVTQTELEGLKVVELDLWHDARGFFTERFHQDRFRDAGLPHDFVQDNWSRSAPGVLRGIHYQNLPGQGKLVGALRGRIWDVAVDLRKGSPTFGRYFGLELNGDNGLLLWIPGGFGHAFCVLGSEPADVLYKVDCKYDASKEGGIRWSDPDLNIDWPLTHPLVSPKDEVLPSLKDFAKSSGF